MKNEKAKGIILVVSAGILWGIIGLFSRNIISAGFSSVQVTCSRCVVTAVICGLFLLITDRKKLKISFKDIWMFIGTGLVSIVFFNICYFITIQQTTLSVAAILLYTAPVFVMLFSAILFKEKITVRKVIALVVAFIGCALITGLLSGSPNITLTGILTGLGSGLGYGLYSIFSRYALKKYHPFTVTFYTFAVASVCVLPFSAPAQMLGCISEAPITLLFILLLGFVSTLLPFFLYTAGLNYLEASKASVIAFVEPLVSALTGVVFFSEKLDVIMLVGMFLIFASLVLLNINLGHKNKSLPEEEEKKE